MKILRYRKILHQKHHSGKYNFTDHTIKNPKDEKRQLEDKDSSHSNDINTVDFLNHVNFDNGDFDDNAIDYIEECI